MPKHLILKIFIIFSLVTSAQNTSQLKSDINHILQTSRNYFSAPANFSSKDYQTIGIVGAIVSASSFFDDDIKNFAQSNYDSSNFLLKNFDSFYHLEFMSVTSLGLFLYGNLSNQKKARDLSFDLLTSSFLTSLTTIGMKSLFGRARPYTTDNQYDLKWFEFQDDFMSFPSGHTSLAFSFSTVMAEESKSLLWKSFWYSSAAMVGFSRIYNNKHWFSDVLMGAIIGYFTAKFVTNQRKNISSSEVNLPTNKIVILIRL
jgi:membrane-associated phospholipid phosphatase